MTMLKKNGGFSLIELVVVIAILAILAGVAVPAYSNYITKAKDAKVLVDLDAVAKAVHGALASRDDLNGIEIHVDPAGNITVDGVEELTAAEEQDFARFYGAGMKLKEELANTSFRDGAVWTRDIGWNLVLPNN